MRVGGAEICTTFERAGSAGAGFVGRRGDFIAPRALRRGRALDALPGDIVKVVAGRDGGPGKRHVLRRGGGRRRRRRLGDVSCDRAAGSEPDRTEAAVAAEGAVAARTPARP